MTTDTVMVSAVFLNNSNFTVYNADRFKNKKIYIWSC